MLTWAPTCDYFHGPEVSRYIKMQSPQTAAQENEAEAKALAEYGVTLRTTQDYGYYWEPPGLKTARAPEPWEKTLIEQMGTAVPRQCPTAPEWNNEEVLFEIREGIAYCTLNRPAANNAINTGIGNGLHDAALILRSRPDIRVVVLTGAGRMFCAGGDPKSYAEEYAREGERLRASQGAGASESDKLNEDETLDNPTGNDITGFAGAYVAKEDHTYSLERTLMEWATLPQFTICCMNGSAMGGGVGLVCACDMVIGLKTAHIVLSEVKLGVIPAAVAPFVIRTVGPTIGKRILVSAETVSMPVARQWGIVQRTVEEVAGFAAVVKEVVGKIQACAPGAVAATKKTLFACDSKVTSQAMIDFAADEYVKVRTDKECEEGMKALASKKRPAWMEKQIAAKE